MAAEAPSKSSGEQQHSTSDLFSSAKVVAEAAQSTFRNESDKVDKAKAADAAGDLLDAAGQYAKLDEQQGTGQYVDKAADYLHQYQSSTGTAPSDHSTTAPSERAKPAESQGDAQSWRWKAGGFLKKH